MEQPRGHRLRHAAERDPAQCERSIPGALVYSPAAATVLNAGNAQTLSVTFTPDDAANYATATRSVTINVLQATPEITWAIPRTSPTARH